MIKEQFAYQQEASGKWGAAGSILLAAPHADGVTRTPGYTNPRLEPYVYISPHQMVSGILMKSLGPPILPPKEIDF